MWITSSTLGNNVKITTTNYGYILKYETKNNN